MIGKIIRWLLAAGFVIVCVWLVMHAVHLSADMTNAADAAASATDEVGSVGHEHVRAMPFYVFAAVALIAAIGLAAPDLIGMACGAIGQFFSSFIFPEARDSKPALSYTLARHYVNESRFEEAVEEYQKILRYYPKEKDAYVELLAAAAQCGDTKAYQKYARLLKKRFNCEIEVVYEEPVEGEAAEEVPPPPAEPPEGGTRT